MKTNTLGLYGLILSSVLVSCNKSSEADVEMLQDMLESQTAKSTLYIGMEYQGGTIFYLDESARHGLIAAREDLGPAPWGCFGAQVMGARTAGGLVNTQAILESCPEGGIAARLCDQYATRDIGSGKTYADWFMPSSFELRLIQQNLKSVSGFSGRTYWSSTEEPAGFMAAPVNQAEQLFEFHFAPSADPDICGIFSMPVAKTQKRYVRPVRAF